MLRRAADGHAPRTLGVAGVPPSLFIKFTVWMDPSLTHRQVDLPDGSVLLDGERDVRAWVTGQLGGRDQSFQQQRSRQPCAALGHVVYHGDAHPDDQWGLERDGGASLYSNVRYVPLALSFLVRTAFIGCSFRPAGLPPTSEFSLRGGCCWQKVVNVRLHLPDFSAGPCSLSGAEPTSPPGTFYRWS